MTAFRPVPATGFMPLAAVFDLDHTLIAGDATIGWTEYLYERGVVTDPVFREINERMKASYHAGTLDIAAWLREAVPAYSGLDEAERNALVSDFIEEKIRPIAYPQGFETIRAAKAAGMLTLIISASNAFFVKRTRLRRRRRARHRARRQERPHHARALGHAHLPRGQGRAPLRRTRAQGAAPRRDGLLHRQPQRPAARARLGRLRGGQPRPRAARGRSRERMAGERMEALRRP